VREINLRRIRGFTTVNIKIAKILVCDAVYFDK